MHQVTYQPPIPISLLAQTISTSNLLLEHFILAYLADFNTFIAEHLLSFKTNMFSCLVDYPDTSQKLGTEQ